ncbi:MAG TPA: diaminopimelate decarboxylase [Candidatus Deferrimicrobium sp.]|nr:diaminopimelate decarboxylase [Candidatus Deferrimicrobium sp.]
MIDLSQKNLEVKDGHLWIGGCDTVQLVANYGTPIYIVNEKTIRQRFTQLKQVLESNYTKVRIHYAVKANSNVAILKILQKEGGFLDCVSVGEIFTALRAGFSPDQIIYTGNNFTNADLEYALKQGVIINLDALSQIQRLQKIMKKTNLQCNLLSFRVNPEFGSGFHDHCITAGPDSKFGILESSIIQAYEEAQKLGFSRFGIHMHFGSGILEINPFKIAAEKYLEIAGKIHDSLGIHFEFMDFGGGLGIPYRPDQKPFDLEGYAKTILRLFKDKIKEANLGEPTFCIEPGRYIVAESTIILSQVNTIKQTANKIYVGIDAGFNNLIRPAMYDSYHEIVVANKMDQKPANIYDIAGPLCESGDILGRERPLPAIEEGDIVGILDAGAYGFTMASNYNLRPLAAEILVRDNNSYVIRERQSLEDLLKYQSIPEFL